MSNVAPITANIDVSSPPFNIHYNDDYRRINTALTQLNVVFDNDIFNNTDYYYTNGVYIELITKLASHSPISKLLVGMGNSQINLYGFSLTQNIYTPTDPDIIDISYGDRPFSAFLTLGQFRNSYNFSKKISIKSSINFGVLGPSSMGGFVQSSIHNIEPIGWTNQIHNNIVIDYNINIEKSIISGPHAELNVTAGGNVGTIFDKINGGLFFRTGSFVPVYRGAGNNNISKAGKNKLQFWFFMQGKTNIVYYDATLQGGMFNTNNPYVINNKDISRVVISLSAGIALYYNGFGLELQDFYLSPEFNGSYDFRWGRIKLTFQLS